MVGGSRMQIENLRIAVYEMTNEKFENIGEINQLESLMWPKNYSGYSQIKLTAPITDENKEFFKKGRVLWRVGDNTAAIIEIINSSVKDDGSKVFEIKGRTLECLLEKRIVWNVYQANNLEVSKIIENLVNQNCVSPFEEKRKIPRMTISPYISSGESKKDSYQKTGGTVYEAISDLVQEAGMGFEIQFVPDLESLIFRVYKGKNRTINQNDVDAIVFSDDTDDILTSSYEMNSTGYKNVAKVAGEGEGSLRTYVNVEDSITDEKGEKVKPTGLLRDEMFIDARDLQSTYTDDDGNEKTLSTLEYLGTLIHRGEEKLSENAVIENFECDLRMYGAQFEFDKDYFLGDIVTFVDTALGITIDARITAVEDDYSDEHKKIFTFGYGYPSLIQKIKRVIS